MTGKVILGVAAHCDDLDFGCSGTMAKFIKKGAKAYYLILTDGSKGHDDHTIPNKTLTETRRVEQTNAGKILGLEEVIFLDFVDGELMNTPEVRKEIVKVIRKIKPDIVFTNDPTFVYSSTSINHPDHRAAGQATLDAVFPYSRNSRTWPELIEEGLHMHKVSEVFLNNRENADFFVDISETIEQKLEALACHKSQHEDSQVLKTRVRERAAALGKPHKFKYAEGFVRIIISG